MKATLKCLGDCMTQWAPQAHKPLAMATLAAAMSAAALLPANEARAQSYGQGAIEKKDESTLLGRVVGVLATSRLGGASTEGRAAAAVLGWVAGGEVQKGIQEKSHEDRARQAAIDPDSGLFPNASRTKALPLEEQGRFTDMFLDVAAWRTVLARAQQKTNDAQLRMATRPGQTAPRQAYEQAASHLGEVRRGLSQSYENAATAARIAGGQGYDMASYIQGLRGISESVNSSPASNVFPGSGWASVEAKAVEIERSLESGGRQEQSGSAAPSTYGLLSDAANRNAPAPHPRQRN